MILRYINIIGLMLLIACQKTEPPYQIPNEQWVKILTDMHLSESATQHLSLSLRDSVVEVYLEQILEIHEVPRIIFEPEYERIKKDPAKLQVVYAGVIKRLGELKLKEKAKNKKKTKKGKVSQEKTLPQ